MSVFRFRFTILLIMLFASLFFAIPLQAQEPTEPPPPLPEVPFGWDPVLSLPYLPSENEPPLPEIAPQTQVEANDVGSWSKITFQSYRDGNWEIYLANGAGTGTTRLTYQNAADVHPHYNRGATNLVFASNRTGYYEIYGLFNGVLQQLTHSASDNLYPKWSPDGSKIAFQSYRDGMAQIYVMNADGSNQIRLTTDGIGSAYPDWSPDGTKIAFASIRSGVEAIWAMNADGTAPVQLGPANPLSAHPVWSPDGSQIAFEAKSYNYGYGSTIWVMNADGSNQRWLDLYYPFLHPTTWSPQGDEIGITGLKTVYYQGNYYWTEAYIFAMRISCCAPPKLRHLGQSSRDWNPSWEPTDITPPTINFAPPEKYEPYHNVSLKWNAYDIGPAGVKDYTVQYHTGDGNWQPWLENTSQTTTFYNAPSGSVVTFRIRSRDLAYNNSNWKTQTIPAETKLFSHYLSGQIKDSRDIVKPEVELTITPEGWDEIKLDLQGRFKTRLAQFGPHQFSLTATQYGVFSPTTQILNRDQTINYYLPPLDNIVNNWGFEDNNGSLAGWRKAGFYRPSVTTTVKHSGQASVFLGNTTPFTTSLVANLPSDMVDQRWNHGNIATTLDPNGTLHFAYYTGRTYQSYKIWYISRTAQGTWSNPAFIKEVTANGTATPNLNITRANNQIHIIWNYQSNPFYSHKINGVWTTESLPFNPIKVIGDHSGNLHMLYAAPIVYDPMGFPSQFQSYHIHLTPDGIWSTPEPVALILGGQDITMAIDRENIHFLWQIPYDGIFPDKGTYYRQLTFNGHWSDTEQISGLTNERWGKIPDLGIDNNYGIHATWGTHDQAFYSYKPQNGTWSEPLILPTEYYEANIVTTSENKPFIGYTGLRDTGPANAAIMHLQSDGTWTSQLIGVHDSPMNLMIDQEDKLHIVASPGFIDSPSYLTDKYPVSSTNSTLKQTITIPANMHEPTLSFMYQLHGLRPGDTGYFSADIVVNGISTSVFSTSASTPDWAHAWADLSAWKGETVDLVFTAHTTANEPYTQVYLDEVSVGSWLTPVPQKVTPAHFEYGEGGEITISGQNFIATFPPISGTIGTGTLPPPIEWPSVKLDDIPLLKTGWINSTTLTATVPATLPARLYDVWVINPGGQQGVLPTGLAIGKQTYLPLIFKN